MNKALWMKILDSTEESKLAALYKDLSEEERAELESIFEDEEKKAGEDPEETSEDVEKVAADYYAAGKLFAQGFLDKLSEESGE